MVEVEKGLSSEESDLRARISKNMNALASERERLVRLSSAAEALAGIQRELSLREATEQELISVQEVTKQVFHSIHSPREYEVVRGLQRPLKRIGVSDLVSLKEVSTGQRAAFVLSLFMAMNAKADSAPSVLLLDDPVAHIDDFNALSFLDCLRHVALAGRRQIFYATADSRLAGLFTHKFSFLGDEFQRYDLER